MFSMSCSGPVQRGFRDLEPAPAPEDGIRAPELELRSNQPGAGSSSNRVQTRTPLVQKEFRDDGRSPSE